MTTKTLSDLSVEEWLASIWAALRRIEGATPTPISRPPSDIAPLADRLERIDTSIQSLQSSIRAIPAPVVNVPEQTPPTVVVEPSPIDLGEIVRAISTLGVGNSPDAIAEAIAARLVPGETGQPSEMGELVTALKEVAWRMKGMGTQAYGGGSSQLQAQRPDGSWDSVKLNASGELVVTTAAGGGGGGTASTVTINDPTTTTQKLGVDAAGRIGVNVNGTVPVSGTFWQATQPVSGSGVFHVDDNAGSLTVDSAQLPTTLGQKTMAGSMSVALASDQGTVPISGTVGISGTVPVSGTFWQATQPVSGTVTVANPTANPETGLAKDATLTGGTQKTKLIDSAGTNVAAVSAAGAVKVDGSAVTQPVSGTFWQATQPVSGSVSVGNFPATQPVSGSVTANIGTTNGLALDATLTGGTQKAVVRSAAKGATAAGDVTSTAVDANTQGLDVAVKGTVPVSGTFWQATQPVSLATNAPDVTDRAARLLGHVTVDNASLTVATGLVSPASLGQKAMAASLPVVVASDQSPIPINGTLGTRTTGTITTATSVVGPATIDTMNIVTVTLSGATFAGVSFLFEGSDDAGTTWYPLQGCRTDVAVVENGGTLLGNANAPRAWDVPCGGVNRFRVRATAWTSGTATIGINPQVLPYEPSPAVGLTTVGGTAVSLGQKAMAASIPVALASDQSSLSVNPNTVGTLNNGAQTAITTTAAQIVAANASRKKLIVQNNGTAPVRIGTTGVTATTGFRLNPGDVTVMDMPHCPTNVIFAISESGTNNVLAQEIV